MKWSENEKNYFFFIIRRGRPLASEHGDSHPLPLFPFSSLVAVTEMTVKAQSIPEES